jgi:hypothetical protein
MRLAHPVINRTDAAALLGVLRHHKKPARPVAGVESANGRLQDPLNELRRHRIGFSQRMARAEYIASNKLISLPTF